jgi:hypothetical protein
MPALGAPIKLAGARLRRRPGRALGPALGIALAAAFAGGVAVEGTIAGEQASRAALRSLSPAARTVTVTWQGVVTPAVRRRARGLVHELGLGAATEVTLLNPVRLGGEIVRPAAISPLAPWVRANTAPPGRCAAAGCPMLVAGGRIRAGTGALASIGVRLTIAGHTNLRSAVPLGFVPASRGGTPLLVTGDVAGLDALGGLSGIYRTHSWLASLPVAHLHSWQLPGLRQRLQRAQAALLFHSSSFTLTAPFAGLGDAHAQARAAPQRLLLTGGGALAALALFLVLAVGGLRRDVDAELHRLRAAGARTAQCVLFVGAEAGLITTAALALGAAMVLVTATVLAALAGEPVGGVLTHSLLSGTGAAALAGAWMVSTALLAGLLLLRRAAHIADALALAALAAVALALARGGTSTDPLAVLLAPLCCLAAGVLVYRGAGAALRAGERIARNGPLPVRLAFVGLARAPGVPALSIAFLAVATGLGGFAFCYRATLLRGTADEAANAVPLDAIVAPAPDFTAPLQLAGLARWNVLAGGTAWPVRRTDATFTSGEATVTVPALGLPAAALGHLRGWRSSDGSAPLQALARRLAAAGPARTPGPMLPAGARALTVRASATRVAATVTAALRDPSGQLERVALGQAYSTRPRRLRARVPAARGPWELEALELAEPAGLAATNGHQNSENAAASTELRGSIGLRSLTALSATGRPLARLAISGWRAVGSAGRARARPGALTVRFSDDGGTGVIRPPQPSDRHPLPVFTDATTAAAAGPGGALPLTVDGEPVQARVAGVLKRFPTIPSGSAGFVIADEAGLASALDAQLPGQGAADELWISTPDPERLRTALSRPPFTQLRSSFRGAVERRLRSAPIARAVFGVLVAAAALSLLLAVIGLLVATLGAGRNLATERDLVAQGAGPRGVRRELRLRLGLAGVTGVLAGVVIALVLTRLAVAGVRAAGTLAAPQPPLVAVVPAAALAVWGLAAIAVLLMAGWTATRTAASHR